LDEQKKEYESPTSIRQQAIHAKGFDLFDFGYTNPNEIPPEQMVTEYGKIKVGVK